MKCNSKTTEMIKLSLKYIGILLLLTSCGPLQHVAVNCDNLLVTLYSIIQLRIKASITLFRYFNIFLHSTKNKLLICNFTGSKTLFPKREYSPTLNKA